MRFPITFHWSWLVTVSALLTWMYLPGTIARTALFPLWVTAWLLLTFGNLEIAKLRRRAWLGQYLKEQSCWHRLLEGDVVMLLWHLITSAVVSLVLLALLRTINPYDAVILMSGLILFVAASSIIQIAADRHIRVEYQDKVTRRFAIPAVALLLALSLVVANLFYPQPYLIGVAWSEALQHHVASDAGGSLLGSLERGALATKTGALWAIQNSLELMELNNAKIKVAVWLLYFLTQGALAWAFVRLLAGQAALLDHLQIMRKQE